MIASTPAKGPSPTTLIQISAQISISTLRMVSSEAAARGSAGSARSSRSWLPAGQAHGQHGSRQRSSNEIATVSISDIT